MSGINRREAVACGLAAVAAAGLPVVETFPPRIETDRLRDLVALCEELRLQAERARRQAVELQRLAERLQKLAEASVEFIDNGRGSNADGCRR